MLVEHQSTINENMCIRMLIYIAEEYKKITNSKDLYKKKRLKIPTPEFIVLYNGKDEFPDYKEMRISDSFEIKNETCFLELVAKVYNINKGRNVEMASRSPALDGYETFIAEIKSNLDTMNLADAIKAAIKICLSKNILVYFLREHGSEVLNMIFGEWNWDDAIAVAKEEGREDGREQTLEEVFSILESGVPLSEAKKRMGLD